MKLGELLVESGHFIKTQTAIRAAFKPLRYFTSFYRPEGRHILLKAGDLGGWGKMRYKGPATDATLTRQVLDQYVHNTLTSEFQIEGDKWVDGANHITYKITEELSRDWHKPFFLIDFLIRVGSEPTWTYKELSEQLRLQKKRLMYFATDLIQTARLISPPTNNPRLTLEQSAKNLTHQLRMNNLRSFDMYVEWQAQGFAFDDKLYGGAVDWHPMLRRLTQRRGELEPAFKQLIHTLALIVKTQDDIKVVQSYNSQKGQS